MTSKERSIVPAQYVDIYASNRGTTLQRIVQDKDEYSFHMMNIIDYLVGNTDRHLENWGFWVNNHNNKLESLHPLMDFNRAFRSYDTLDGARCLTTEQLMSQKDAAIIGVRKVGLNLVRDLPEDIPALFRNLNDLVKKQLDTLFMQRLELLMKTSMGH